MTKQLTSLPLMFQPGAAANIFAPLLLLLAIHPACSQTAPAANTELQVTEENFFTMSLEDLLQVRVSSASRTQRTINQLPNQVYVITAQDIKRNHYTSLVEILQDTPFVVTSRPGNAVEGETFLMRGLRGNAYSKILLNGLPMAPSLVSGMPLGEQIPLQQVERIEIIYGAGAALYGADSIGGIINIITQSPQRIRQIEGGLLVAEDYQHANLLLPLLDPQSDAALFAYLQYSEAHDQPVVKGYEDIYRRELYGNNTGLPEFSRLPAQNYALGLQGKVKDWSFSLDHLYRRQHSSIGQHTEWYRYDDPSLLWGESQTRLSVSLDQPLALGKLKHSFLYSGYRLDKDSAFWFTFEPMRGYKYAYADDALLESFWSYEANEHWEWLVGGSLAYSEGIPKTRDLAAPFNAEINLFEQTRVEPDPIYGTFGINPISYHQEALFVQAIYTRDNWVAHLNLRGDEHSIYGGSLSPRLALAYNPSSRLSFHASYNEAFRAPSAYFAYQSVACCAGTSAGDYGVIAAPGELKPEEAQSIEIGGHYLLSDATSAEMSLFHTRVSGLINFTLDDHPLGVYTHPQTQQAQALIGTNEGESQIWGLELLLKHRTQWAGVPINSEISYATIDGQFELPEQGGEIQRLRNAPEWLLKLLVTTELSDDWYVKLSAARSGAWLEGNVGQANQQLTTQGATRWTLASEYQFNKQLWLDIKIDNLTNRHYGSIAAYDGNVDLRINPQYGRRVFLGLRYAY